MKNVIKRKSIWIGLFLIMLVSLAASVAKKQFDRAALKEELKAYFDENIKPVLKEKRSLLDQELSSIEKTEIENIRSQMKVEMENRRGASEKMDGERKGRGFHEDLTEEQLTERRAKMKSHRKLMEQAWVIVDNHEATFDKIMADLTQNRNTWQKDIKAIMEKHIEERKKGEKGKQGDHPMKGRKEGKGFGGRYGRGISHKMMMLEKSDVMFLLWDGKSDFMGKRGGRDKSTQNIQIFPNPGTDNSQIEYVIETAGNVVITIHNKQGELIKSVINEEKTAGTYTQSLDISDLENGLYFYKITSADGMVTKRFIKK